MDIRYQEGRWMKVVRWKLGLLLSLLPLVAAASCDGAGSGDGDGDGDVDGDAGGDASADGDGDTDGGADADGDADTDGDAEGDSCPMCLDAAYEVGWDGGMVAWTESYTLTPCSELRAERRDHAGSTLLSCEVDIAGCDTASMRITTPHIVEALTASDVEAAFEEGTVLYGQDTRPMDGPVFRIARGEGGTDGVIFVGTDCAGAAGCDEIPAGVDALMNVLRTLIEQVPSYEGCSDFGP